MRIVSAIVFLLWTVCYGHCLPQKYDTPVNSEAACCSSVDCGECHDQPALPAPCGLCEFMTTGSVLPGQALLMEAPAFFCLPVPELIWLLDRMTLMDKEEQRTLVAETGPPEGPWMCEWMASTAAPVRGPDLRA